MMIYTNCNGCGVRCQPFGFRGGEWRCGTCYTKVRCHDCHELHEGDELKDYGDGFQVCDGCVAQVETQRTIAQEVHR